MVCSTLFAHTKARRRRDDTHDVSDSRTRHDDIRTTVPDPNAMTQAMTQSHPASPKNVPQASSQKNHPLAQKFCTNEITTSHYTPSNFLVKNLWQQFQRAANIYFLVIGCLQLDVFFPGLSPTHWSTTIGAFAFLPYPVCDVRRLRRTVERVYSAVRKTFLPQLRTEDRTGVVVATGEPLPFPSDRYHHQKQARCSSSWRSTR